MKTKMKTLACIAPLIGLLGFSAYAQTWDLAGDFNPPANPNGAWSYGQLVGGVFTPLPWVPISSPNTPGEYGVAYVSGFVYQNTASYLAYGITPGQVSLESDWGNAAAQWTAPSTGLYDITAAIGGTTESGGGGFGNNFAQYAGLSVDGVSQAAASFSGNVMSWNVTDVSLAAGETVDAYVLNPGYANGGNTQTAVTITEVNSAPDATGTVALLGFGISVIEFIRRRK